MTDTNYKWTDNCCESGKAVCNTDVLNDCLMHLKYNQGVTNCLTEIPQRIKYTLNNGTLTLIAGSQFIFPNGFETDGKTPKFDHVEIENDVRNNSTTSNMEILITISKDSRSHVLFKDTQTTEKRPAGPKQHTLYYITETNKVEYYDGSNWISDLAFPFVMGTRDQTGIASINMLFNGIGYIGSTIWMDKGVKCLIPDGRNEDGGLNNIIATAQRVLTFTIPPEASAKNRLAYITLSTSGLSYGWAGENEWNYYEKDNYVRYGKINQYSEPRAFIGTITLTSNTIIDFNPKTTFHAVDFNEFETELKSISSVSMPSEDNFSTLGIAVGQNYAAPADGYVNFRAKATGGGAWIQLASYAIDTYDNAVQAGQQLSCLIPIKKGAGFYINYANITTEGTTGLRFIYAEGAV